MVFLFLLDDLIAAQEIFRGQAVHGFQIGTDGQILIAASVIGRIPGTLIGIEIQIDLIRGT